MAYTALNQGFMIEGSIIGGSSAYDISNMILDVMIKKSFLDSSFPLFVIDLKTTEEIRDYIRDNDVNISLKIYVYDMDENNDTSEEDNDSPTITDTYFDGTIRLYDKPFTTTSAKTEEDGESDESNTQSESAPFVYYRVSGIPDNLIEKNSHIINEVYSNAALDDVLVNVASSMDDGNIYIEPSNNKTINKSVFIPPSTFTQAIDFLDGNYQIYEGPCCIFLDSDCTYIYNPISKDLETSNVFEYRVLNVDSSANSADYLKTAIDKSTNNLKMSVKSISGFASEDKIVGNSLGSDVNYYSYDDNYNLVIRGENSDLSFDKTKYFWNPKRKSIFETAELNIREMSAKALIINLRDVNPGYIKPTTLFTVSASEYPEVEGNYFPSVISVSFASEDLLHYSGITSITLHKK